MGLNQEPRLALPAHRRGWSSELGQFFSGLSLFSNLGHCLVLLFLGKQIQSEDIWYIFL